MKRLFTTLALAAAALSCAAEPHPFHEIGCAQRPGLHPLRHRAVQSAGLLTRPREGVGINPRPQATDPAGQHVA